MQFIGESESGLPSPRFAIVQNFSDEMLELTSVFDNSPFRLLRSSVYCVMVTMVREVS